MSTLSLYIGDSVISALHFKSQSDFDFDFFPFGFVGFTSRDNEAEIHFFNQVFDHFAKRFNLDLSSVEVKVISKRGLKVPLKSTKIMNLTEIMNRFDPNLEWVIVDDFSAMTKNFDGGFLPYSEKLSTRFLDSEFSTYIGNKTLYPHIVCSNPRINSIHDLLLQKIFQQADLQISNNGTVVFSGLRFTRAGVSRAITYLFALGLISNPGFFKIFIDLGIKIPLIASLGKTISSGFEDEFVNLGTVLKIPGGGQVLFSLESQTTPQLIDIKSNDVFILPLELGDKAKVSVSAQSLGKQENYVKGGQLGFVIDSREARSEKLNRDWLRAIEERLIAF